MAMMWNPCLPQVRHHPLGIGKARLVPGEDAIAVHVINVEEDAVAGNAALAEILRDEAHLALRIVAVAALDVAQRPARRHGDAPHQFREAADHLLRSRSGEEVIVHLAALRAEGVEVGKLRRHVERRAVGVVEEDAVSAPLAQARGRTAPIGTAVRTRHRSLPGSLFHITSERPRLSRGVLFSPKPK